MDVNNFLVKIIYEVSLFVIMVGFKNYVIYRTMHLLGSFCPHNAIKHHISSMESYIYLKCINF